VVEAESSCECPSCGSHIAGAKCREGDGGVPGPVGVVDHSVEGLIEPLPEHYRGHCLVERHHAAGDGHVERNLRRHSAGQEHFFSSVRVVGRVIEMLGLPQLLISESGVLPPPVLVHSRLGLLQRRIRSRKIEGVSGGEELLGTTPICSLVPERFI